tara:strand:- start:320 stop:2311 length:1992 start_codon:yes stop_codon:yes gene_type:complete
MDKDLEKQLEDLQKNFAGLAKTLSSSSKGILNNTKDSKTFNHTQKLLNKSMDDYKKKIKEGEGYFHEFGDAIEAAKKDVKGFSMNLKAIPSPLGLVVKAFNFVKDTAIAVGTAMIKTALALSDATKQFKGLEDVMSVGFGDLPYVGKVVNRFSREIDTNVGTFRTLAQTGASFGSSIVALRKAQEDTLMPLTKFMGLIQDNSSTLAKLFGTVDQGIPQIVPFMNKLRDVTMDEFAKFGLTLDETSTFLGTFLELERARGNTTRMTQDQLMSATRSYTKDLVILSKLTGKSVDELNEQNAAMAADGVFQSQLTNMNAKDAKTLSLGIGELNGPMKQLAKEVIGLGGPISQTSIDLAAMSNGAFLDAIKQFERDKDLVAFQNAIKTTSKNVMQNSESFGQASLAGGRFTEALNAIAASVGEAVSQADIDKELKAAGDNIAEILNITTGELDKTKAALETAVVKGLTPLALEGPKAASGVKRLRETLDTFSDEGMAKINRFIESMGEFIIGGKDAVIDKDAEDEKQGKKKKSFQYMNNAFSYMDIPEMYTGSKGFQNFGTGTPAILHGTEAVVPKNDFGQALDVFKEALAFNMPVSNAAQQATVTNNNTTTNSMDMSTLNANTEQLIALNERVANHLNTLITIGAMTEKNTKNTIKQLANRTGSLV